MGTASDPLVHLPDQQALPVLYLIERFYQHMFFFVQTRLLATYFRSIYSLDTLPTVPYYLLTFKFEGEPCPYNAVLCTSMQTLCSQTTRNLPIEL